MIVVCGFQRIGVFRIIGSRLLEKVSTMRGLVITLVALTFFSAMFITNDVALVTFVPFAVAVLIMAGQEDKTILVVTLMTIGANVGSMLTPIGNAHNLYLKEMCIRDSVWRLLAKISKPKSMATPLASNLSL